MSGHYICDSCGYDGDHADYCRHLRPVDERWKGNRTCQEMDELRKRGAVEQRPKDCGK